METNEQPKSVVDPSATKKAKGHTERLKPFFTKGSPKVQFENRTADIRGKGGKQVFYAENLEFPVGWSQNAVNITAEKYFRMVEQPDGSLKRETSVRQMVERVVSTITAWGLRTGHFIDEDEADTFALELQYILLTQRASFNSPVWFNIGTHRGRWNEEQASACFINSIADDMGSILELTKTEGMLYKGGSGSGINYSPLRSSLEGLSGGGTASGPVPFIAAHDSNGGAIKSGGTTRRAAKMNILNVDHGDIEEFINCKATAERMAHALIDAGFESDFRARFGAYQSVPFQNANHSVRVTDAFMRAVEKDGDWNLLARDGKVLRTVKARHLWEQICDAAWVCGDPGLQFDTLINHMHTCPNHGRINASNPCSEYMHLDDSACNLASINLRKFQCGNGRLDIESYEHTVDVMTTAMDALVDGASYPTPKIGENARKFRQLGLGFANLGSYIMHLGLPYDSDDARGIAGLLTAILCGRAYRRSALLAAHLGPFEGFKKNAQPMLDVIQTHRMNIDVHMEKWNLDENEMRFGIGELHHAAVANWDSALALGNAYGFRNSQATVMAPTGTIAFMMDCDTTGVEPETALVKYKSLVGGGTMKIVNQSVAAALRGMLYSEGNIEEVLAYIEQHGSTVGSIVRSEDQAIFDTSFPESVRGRALAPEAHVLMLAAIQPFVSGAISKTCNLPETATREEIGELYMLAWKEGLKAIALYRDGCKKTQPLSTKKDEPVEQVVAKKFFDQEQLIQQLKEQIADLQEKAQAHRRKLPDERQALTHKFRIGEDFKVYVTCGMYPDGSLGEIFLKSDKEGSTVSGLLDGIATLTSFALQHGVPLASLIKKFKRTSFEPHGWTGNPEIQHAASVLDYVFRFLELRFVNKQAIEVVESEVDIATLAAAPNPPIVSNGNGHAPEKTGKRCPSCDGMLMRTGSCTTCPACGFNSGCG